MITEFLIPMKICPERAIRVKIKDFSLRKWLKIKKLGFKIKKDKQQDVRILQLPDGVFLLQNDLIDNPYFIVIANEVPIINNVDFLGTIFDPFDINGGIFNFAP